MTTNKVAADEKERRCPPAAQLSGDQHAKIINFFCVVYHQDDPPPAGLLNQQRFQCTHHQDGAGELFLGKVAEQPCQRTVGRLRREGAPAQLNAESAVAAYTLPGQSGFADSRGAQYDGAGTVERIDHRPPHGIAAIIGFLGALPPASTGLCQTRRTRLMGTSGDWLGGWAWMLKRAHREP
ncbi:hypothetical protein GCM10017708_13220 [Arthrobacter citreus]